MVPGEVLSVGSNPFSPTTLNRYAYVGGNPANFIDPTGLDFLGLDLEDWTDAFTFAAGTCGVGALVAASFVATAPAAAPLAVCAGLGAGVAGTLTLFD